jgi:hypothetical protein
VKRDGAPTLEHCWGIARPQAIDKRAELERRERDREALVLALDAGARKVERSELARDPDVAAVLGLVHALLTDRGHDVVRDLHPLRGHKTLPSVILARHR